MVHWIDQGVTGYNFQIKIASLFMLINFAEAISVDPEEKLN